MSYPDSILRQVTKPARYTGGEWNAIVKDWAATPVKVSLCYPDIYEVGTPNMALPVLYEILNSRPDTLAERVFTPWVDMAAALRATGQPLLSLESQHSIKDFDILGFTLGYELTYTNILETLDLAGIPVLAAERDESHPLIIAGGSSALNPEPLCDFVDLFILGDGEEVIGEFMDGFHAARESGTSRKELLSRLAAIAGVYVPGLYQVAYNDDGTVKSITASAGAAESVCQRLVAKLPPPVTRPVVPNIETIQDRGAVEISRGCSRGCRFCHAGTIYRPVRERPQEEIIQAVDELVTNCGYDEISLLSLSTSDYTDIEGLVARLGSRLREGNLALSLPSLRISQSSVRLINSLPTRRRSGLTFAPEAASLRLQRVINKVTSDEELTAMATAAIESGRTTLKLYFMLGLPTETMEDVDAIAETINRLRALGKKAPQRRPQLRVSLATFIPKPHTPFQWVAQDDEEVLQAKFERLRQGVGRRGVRLSFQEPKMSLIEAVLSRGDRRTGKVIHRAWQLGSTFDAWSERFNYQNWLKALDEACLEPGFYAHRQRPLDEILPWAHIDPGVTAAYLKKEYRRALAGQETADCRNNECHVCGLEESQPQCRDKFSRLTQNRR
ncbi:MAG: TIGR03960 family B12-binding radical SAM protein [Dehalococcoidales bacterium]